MGMCWYGVCLDCRAWVDLDKFSLAGAVSGSGEIDQEYAVEAAQASWFRSARFIAFTMRHNGHRLHIATEHEMWDGGPEPEWADYREELLWPPPANDPPKQLWTEPRT